jgi:PAS domain S-box-containing protein
MLTPSASSMAVELDRLVQAIDAAGLGIFDHYPLSNERYWSPRCKELFGVLPDTKPSYVGFLERVHPEDRVRTDQIIQYTLTPESSGAYDLEYRTVSIETGKITWVRSTGRAFFNEQGQAVRFIGTVTDISQRKEIMERLQESESRFRLMADNAPVMMWLADINKQYHFFNQTWLKFRGRSLEQEEGAGWLEGVHPEDRERCVKIYTEAINDQKPFNMEYRLLRHDGQYRWITDSGCPVKSSDGKFMGYVGSCMDIQELKEAREQLNSGISK